MAKDSKRRKEAGKGNEEELNCTEWFGERFFPCHLDVIYDMMYEFFLILRDAIE